MAAAASAGNSSAAAAAAAAAQHGQPPKLLLAFSPQLAAGEAEAGSSSEQGGSARSGAGNRAIRDAVWGAPAALLPGTQLCRTQQPHDQLHSVGGVAALLPLLEPPSCGGCGGYSAAAVLRLLAAFLRGSPTNQAAMQQQLGGFAVVACLLEQRWQGGTRSSRQEQLTGELLAAAQGLLSAVAESAELSQGVLR